MLRMLSVRLFAGVGICMLVLALFLGHGASDAYAIGCSQCQGTCHATIGTQCLNKTCIHALNCNGACECFLEPASNLCKCMLQAPPP